MSHEVIAIDQDDKESSDPLLRSFERVGIDPEKIPAAIRERHERSEAYSHFNEAAGRIEAAYEKMIPEAEQMFGVSFSDDETRAAELGVLIHDIGKVGPPEATVAEQEAIVKLYAAEQLSDPKMPLREGVTEVFGEANAGPVLATLKKYGIEAESTMRDFWNIHAPWGHATLETYGAQLPELAKILTSSHHMGRSKGNGFNPYHLPRTPEELATLEADPALKKKYILTLVLIVLDKFEAEKRRRNVGYANTRAILGAEGFAGNPYMEKLISTIERLGEDEDFFSVAREEERLVAAD